jgi:Oxygenase, catalysing oxidative methylation of damaged DNA
VHHRPVQGTRGTYRVNLRHGVSRVRGGHRHTLGIIFHDAEQASNRVNWLEQREDARCR